jgi:hypothetical protein
LKTLVFNDIKPVFNVLKWCDGTLSQ